MYNAWIGVIGTAIGAVIGALVTILTVLREQNRAPRLAVLEKRIEAHQEIFARLYVVSEVVYRAAKGGGGDFSLAYDEFKRAFFKHRFYLDKKSRTAVGEVYKFFQPVLDGSELRPDEFQLVLDKANLALSRGIGLKYE